MTEPVSTVAHVHTRDVNPYLNAALTKVSWGAIFAGVAVALVVQLLLNLLGAGVGAAVIDPGTSAVSTPAPPMTPTNQGSKVSLARPKSARSTSAPFRPGTLSMAAKPTISWAAISRP